MIDKGVVGTNTTAIASQLEENINKYQPNMVITMMGYNDRYMMYYKDMPAVNAGLFRYCSTYRFIQLIYMHILKRLNKEDIYGLDSTDSARETKLRKTASLDKKILSSAKESLKKRGLRFDPKDDKGYVELGEHYQRQGKLYEAERLFKEATRLNSKNSNGYSKLGWTCQVQGKLPEAEELFKKILELTPRIYEEYLGVGVGIGGFYPVQGSKLAEEAEALFKRAIEINPKSEWLYVGLGDIYRSQGKLPKAEALLKEALVISPKNDRIYVILGDVYRSQGKSLSTAEALFKEALALNPKNAWGCRALESLYRETNRIELAEEYNKKSVELNLKEYSYSQIAVDNYHKVKDILDKRGVRLVCVQYVMRNIEPLKKIFDGERGVIFVDNERLFKEVVRQEGYREYFRDMFGGDFGHCSSKGNRLLAENIANVISKNVFSK